MAVNSEWITNRVVLYRINEQFNDMDLDAINEEMESAIQNRPGRQFDVLLDGTNANIVSFTPREMLKHSPYLQSKSINRIIAFGAPMYTATMGSIFSFLHNENTSVQAIIAENESDARATAGLKRV